MSDTTVNTDRLRRISEFRNVVNILRSIDRHELVDAGISAAIGEWGIFRGNPINWLITADDEDAARVWAIVEKRMPTR